MRKNNIIFLLLSIAIIYSFNSNAQTFRQLVEKAKTSKDSSAYFFQLAEKKAANNGERMHLFTVKGIYYQMMGNFDSTLHYSLKVIELGQKKDSTRLVLLAYKSIAKTYSNEGLYDLSSKYTLEGLKIAEGIKDLEWISWFNKMQSLNQHDFESYEKGVEYGKIAFTAAVQSKTKDLTLITYALNAIAINFDDWNKPDSALYYHYKILEYAKGADTVDYYFTYNNIGNTLIKQKKYADASFWLTKSLNTINKAVKGKDSTEFYYDYATTITNLATVAYKQQQYDKAEKWFDQAKYYSEKTGNAEKLRDYYQQRYLFNKERRNIDEMAKYQELYITLRDSVFNSNRAKTFADLEKKYQTEKKEAEIKILNSENKRQRNIIAFTITSLILFGFIAYLLYNRSKLKQKSILQKEIIKQQDEAAKAVINAEEHERQRMSATLHDGLGQLLSAAKMNMQALADNFERSQKEVIYGNAMQLIDESIAEMRSVSHQIVTNNVVRTGLGNALKELIEKINSNHLKVNLEVDGFVQNIDTDIQLVLYRIYQESINNVIKHANADILNIRLIIDDNKIIGSVEDNGKGFDFPSVKTKAGIGLENIFTRIKFLKGTYKIITAPGSGTTLKFEIPV